VNSPGEADAGAGPESWQVDRRAEVVAPEMKANVQ
jgi:hypothetical protein